MEIQSEIKEARWKFEEKMKVARRELEEGKRKREMDSRVNKQLWERNKKLERSPEEEDKWQHHWRGMGCLH